MKRCLVSSVMLILLMIAFTTASFGQIAVGISVRIGPPALPVYAQPICPGSGYIWTPGYWSWNDDEGYYWVPGTWVIAPVGMLWTPGYWGWGGGYYAWHRGYWGPHIGFYGGINYGYGYTGVGFVGGEWRGGAFYYNRSVTNVSVTNVTNVYNRTVVVNNTTVNNVSYNGGNGGVPARPTAQEENYSRESHTAPLEAQTQHERIASQNRQNFAAVNQGRPAVAATARPGDFGSHSVVAARAAGAAYHAPAISPREARVATPAVNHAAPANAASRSNEGFRSFTPPARNNATAPSGRPAASNPAASNPGGSNPRPSSNEGFRPFTPPPAAGNRGNESRPSQSGSSQSRPNQGNPNQTSPQQRSSPTNESRPAPEAPHQNAPHSAPAVPHRQPPPPKEEHRDKGR